MPLLALLCILLWSSAVPMVKLGYAAFGIGENTSVFTKLLFAGTRFTLAGALVLAVGSAAQKKPLLFTRAEAGRVLLFGLFQTFLEYLFYYIGISHATGTMTAIITSMPAFVVVLAAPLFFSGDHLGTGPLLGVAAGFAGIVLASAGSGLRFTLTGEGFLLISTLASATSSMLSRKYSQQISPVLLSGWGLFLGGGALTVIALAGGGRFSQVSPRALLILCYLFSLSAAAFSVWAALLKYNPAGKVCIFNSLSPLFGALLSALMLGENAFTPRILLALALVCTGVYLVNREHRPAAEEAPR